MDQQSSFVVKRKVISSSKLQPIKVKHSSGLPQADVASLESNIASISFSKSNSSLSIKQKLSDELSLSHHHFSRSIGDDSSQSHRFNPFDRSDSNHSSNSSTDSRSQLTSESPHYGLAELGLTEDHFSIRQGSLGLSSAEELNVAIENCKEMILNLPEESKKKKKFVENLVNLKIKLQEIKDSPVTPNRHVKSILGHQLKKKKKNMPFKGLCDCCRSSLWSLVQVWYECKDCSFVCHEKCIDSIRRTCVAKLAKTGVCELKICPEFGLSKQMYCCMECKNPIVVGSGSDEGHLCDYTGYYYCTNCHWNDTMVIPARVVHNWDHEPQAVCRQTFQFLNMIFSRPVLNIEKINPKLFNYVEELGEIKRMREDIIKMKQYFLTCSAALEAKLLRKLSDRQHFIDNSYMYSMEDLVQTHTGVLTEELVKIHGLYAKHIKLDCVVCQGKGFICEICNFGEALFPFDLMVSRCPKCSAVFHSDCFSFIDKSCPRCKRKQEKRKLSMSFICGVERLSSSDEDVEEPAQETLQDGKAISQSSYSAWLSSQTKPSDGKSKPQNTRLSKIEPNQDGISKPPTNTSNLLSNDVFGEKNPFSDKDENTKQFGFVEEASNNFSMGSDADQIRGTSPKHSDAKNPFGAENLEEGDNPFVNDIYDESKNPFCCN